jgi:hypothetical protein
MTERSRLNRRTIRIANARVPRRAFANSGYRVARCRGTGLLLGNVCRSRWVLGAGTRILPQLKTCPELRLYVCEGIHHRLGQASPQARETLPKCHRV